MRSRLTTMLMLLSLSILSFMPVAARAEAAATNPPILLIVNSAAANKLGPYLGEILRAEGLNAFDQVALANVTAAQLAQYDLAILVQTPLTSAQASMLTGYVSGGGALLAMRPDPQIASVFGLSGASGTLSNGYMQISTAATFNGAAPGAGLTTSTLQIHGDTDLYGGVTGTMVARLYSNATTSTVYPAVVAANYGSGQAAAFTYDLPSNIALTRQGNPANANIDVDGDYLVRTVDLFQTVGGGAPWVDRDRIPIPQADEQQRLFARLVQQFVGRRRPLPQLWYFPGTAKSMLVYTSDAHWNSYSDYATLISDLSAHQAPVTMYLTAWPVVGGNSWDWPANSDLQTWQAQGNTFGIHPWRLDGSTLANGFSAVNTWFANTYTVPRSKTVRIHQLQWQGWTDGADIEASYNLGMDFSFYHWGRWLQKPDGTWPHGYITGSGLPMKFIRADGTVTSVYQQLTEMADDQLFAVNGGFEGLSGTQAVALSKSLIDASLAGYYSALTDIHHVDSYSSSSDLQTWAKGAADYARSKGVPVWNADQWLSFTQTRHDANFSNISWNMNASAGVLSFNTTMAATGQTLSTILPLASGGQPLQSVTVDGAPAGFSTESIKGTNVAFIGSAAGNHSVTATYGEPTPTPTNTPMPPTPTDTPLPPTATNTPAPLTCPLPAAPASFWGYVTLNGAPAPAGMAVATWVNGYQTAMTTTQTDAAGTYYHIDVPERATDPDTGKVCRQGGAPEEKVAFSLCSVLAAEPQGTWSGGTLVQVDLIAEGTCGGAAPAPASPHVSIAIANGKGELTWPHIAADTQGNPLSIARYDVWRSTNPYFTLAGDPSASVLPPPGAQAGDPVKFTENSPITANTSQSYLVQAISVIGRPSAISNRVASFAYALVPGSQ
jgi:hypothetical protein